MATMPMLSPDGQTGDVPVASADAALKSGFKKAIVMASPDGKIGYIPEERQADALKAGFVPHLTALPPKINMQGSSAPAVARGATGALPAIGGTLGGLAASPTVAGAAAGAGLGTGIGIEAKQLLNRALFGEGEASPTSGKGLKELGIGMSTSAATAAVLQGTQNYLLNRGAQLPANQSTQALNEAVGATKKSIRIGQNAQTMADATTNPGRGLANVGFDADTLKELTPIERMAAIAPHYKAAGKAIDLAVDDATQQGVTFDAAKSVYNTLKQIKNPQLQEQAIEKFNEIAQEQGIANLRQATPEEGRALRQALAYGARFGPQGDLASLGGVRAQLYRSVTGDLHDAVPGLKEVDQHFSDLKSAITAVQGLVAKDAIKTPETQAANSLVGPIAKKVAAMTIPGASKVMSLVDLLRGNP